MTQSTSTASVNRIQFSMKHKSTTNYRYIIVVVAAAAAKPIKKSKGDRKRNEQ